MITAIRVAGVLIGTHLVAWVTTFLLFVGFSPELAFGYFVDAWSFAAGEMPSLVWLYSWIVFLLLPGALASLRWLLRWRAKHA